MSDTTQIRQPVSNDLKPLAELWHAGWHQAHASLITSDVLPFRTLDQFEARLPAMWADIRVAGDHSEPMGFCYIEGAELDQMYVARAAQGTGLAARLMAEAEDRMRRNGVETAQLSCAAGNERAARFYEKHGWTSDRAIVEEALAAAPGLFAKIWRYTKRLV